MSAARIILQDMASASHLRYVSHFGMIFIVNIMVGGLTPPFGSMMFTVCSIVNVKLEDFIKEVWPFIAALLVVLLLVTYSEGIALFTFNLFS